MSDLKSPDKKTSFFKTPVSHTIALLLTIITTFGRVSLGSIAYLAFGATNILRNITGFTLGLTAEAAVLALKGLGLLGGALAEIAALALGLSVAVGHFMKPWVYVAIIFIGSLLKKTLAVASIIFEFVGRLTLGVGVSLSAFILNIAQGLMKPILGCAFAFLWVVQQAFALIAGGLSIPINILKSVISTLWAASVFFIADGLVPVLQFLGRLSVFLWHFVKPALKGISGAIATILFSAVLLLSVLIGLINTAQVLVSTVLRATVGVLALLWNAIMPGLDIFTRCGIAFVMGITNIASRVLGGIYAIVTVIYTLTKNTLQVGVGLLLGGASVVLGLIRPVAGVALASLSFIFNIGKIALAALPALILPVVYGFFLGGGLKSIPKNISKIFTYLVGEDSLKTKVSNAYLFVAGNEAITKTFSREGISALFSKGFALTGTTSTAQDVLEKLTTSYTSIAVEQGIWDSVKEGFATKLSILTQAPWKEAFWSGFNIFTNQNERIDSFKALRARVASAFMAPIPKISFRDAFRWGWDLLPTSTPISKAWDEIFPIFRQRAPKANQNQGASDLGFLNYIKEQAWAVYDGLKPESTLTERILSGFNSLPFSPLTSARKAFSSFLNTSVIAQLKRQFMLPLLTQSQKENIAEKFKNSNAKTAYQEGYQLIADADKRAFGKGYQLFAPDAQFGGLFKAINKSDFFGSKPWLKQNVAQEMFQQASGYQGTDVLDKAKQDFQSIKYYSSLTTSGTSGFIKGAVIGIPAVPGYLIYGAIQGTFESGLPGLIVGVIHGLWKALSLPFRNLQGEASAIQREEGERTTYRGLFSLMKEDLIDLNTEGFVAWRVLNVDTNAAAATGSAIPSDDIMFDATAEGNPNVDQKPIVFQSPLSTAAHLGRSQRGSAEEASDRRYAV